MRIEGEGEPFGGGLITGCWCGGCSGDEMGIGICDGSALVVVDAYSEYAPTSGLRGP